MGATRALREPAVEDLGPDTAVVSVEGRRVDLFELFGELTQFVGRLVFALIGLGRHLGVVDVPAVVVKRGQAEADGTVDEPCLPVRQHLRDPARDGFGTEVPRQAGHDASAAVLRWPRQAIASAARSSPEVSAGSGHGPTGQPLDDGKLAAAADQVHTRGVRRPMPPERGTTGGNPCQASLSNSSRRRSVRGPERARGRIDGRLSSSLNLAVPATRGPPASASAVRVVQEREDECPALLGGGRCVARSLDLDECGVRELGRGGSAPWCGRVGV